MVGHGGSSAGSYLADPTSPIPSQYASIVATSTVRVNAQYSVWGAFSSYLYHSPYPFRCSISGRGKSPEWNPAPLSHGPLCLYKLVNHLSKHLSPQRMKVVKLMKVLLSYRSKKQARMVQNCGKSNSLRRYSKSYMVVNITKFYCTLEI